ncbi:MAG: hypothetical protein J6T57_01690 [Alphaproteobacteria bacterium]|nr:hypothetical protein [Alphaproteobacteria bacterium]
MWKSFCVGMFFCGAAVAGDLTVDTSDPLFLTGRGQFLSQSELDYFETGLRFGQYVSYGLADRFVIGGNFHYQQDFSGPEDGFSSFDLGGVYRIGAADENDRHIIYDVLLGLKFGGSHRVRTPDFADSTYYAGLRFGRQYAGVTLAGTVKSSWIFDKTRGMAFIDFVPEVYFRVNDNWRIGGNFALRKATNTHYDEESVGIKIVREYGRTQYVGHCEYAFESEDVTAGARVNILF